MKQGVILGAALAICCGVLMSSTADPVGDEFPINSTTPGEQFVPQVAINDSGRFVVVWQSDSSSGDDDYGTSIQGQRFAAEGTNLGPEFQVNSTTARDQTAPSIAMDQSGAFVIVWESDIPFGSAVLGQRFSAEGTPIGGEFEIPSHVTAEEARPRIAMTPAGSFVVVWEAWEGGSSRVVARRYSASGTPLGDEFQVNSTVRRLIWTPSLSIDTTGDFVVVWDDSLYGDSRVMGQSFAADGSAVGGEFRVDTYVGSYTWPFPEVGLADTGEFTVVWQSTESTGNDDDDHSIQGQRFGSDGLPDGGQFQINTTTLGSQGHPSISTQEDGEFVVVWHGYFDAADPYTNYYVPSIVGQWFNSDGTPINSEFVVNTERYPYPNSYRYLASVETNSIDGFVVVWESYPGTGTYTYGYDIQGRLYKVKGLFADGFESGDTSAWTSTVP